MTALEQMKAEEKEARTALDAARTARVEAEKTADGAYRLYARAAAERDVAFNTENKLWERWLELNNAVLNAAHSKTVEE